MLQYAEQLRNTLILIQAFYSAVLLLLSKDALSHCVFNFQFFFSNFCVMYTNFYSNPAQLTAMGNVLSNYSIILFSVLDPDPVEGLKIWRSKIN